MFSSLLVSLKRNNLKNREIFSQCYGIAAVHQNPKGTIDSKVAVINMEKSALKISGSWSA